jgi:hypothetical protein
MMECGNTGMMQGGFCAPEPASKKTLPIFQRSGIPSLLSVRSAGSDGIQCDGASADGKIALGGDAVSDVGRLAVF